MSTSKPVAKTARPHRRLSLTMPTEPVIDAPAAMAPATVPAPIPVETPAEPTQIENESSAAPAVAEESQTVRVMSYLTEDEATVLDELWLQFRRLPARPSKSDIMRAALSLAALDRNALANLISSQQISTLTRQRSSKIGYRKADRA